MLGRPRQRHKAITLHDEVGGGIDLEGRAAEADARIAQQAVTHVDQLKRAGHIEAAAWVYAPSPGQRVPA